MDVLVLVPRRRDPWRDRLWWHVREHLANGVEWPVVEGFHEAGAFNRAAAINAAARRPWRVAVILDADTIVDGSRLRAGVEAARHGRLVLPHDQFRSLSKQGTKEVLRGSVLPENASVRWVREKTKSSCLCIGRELWDEIGGFDERFVGWGFEDAAFYAACAELAGVKRIPGPVHHLWHPRSPEKDPECPDYVRNRERAARYKRVRGRRAMLDLLAELRG